MSEPSWRQVAEVLAERVGHQASQASVSCPHPRDALEPDDCPFCADRVAWLIWRDKEMAANRRDARRKGAS